MGDPSSTFCHYRPDENNYQVKSPRNKEMKMIPLCIERLTIFSSGYMFCRALQSYPLYSAPPTKPEPLQNIEDPVYEIIRTKEIRETIACRVKYIVLGDTRI